MYKEKIASESKGKISDAKRALNSYRKTKTDFYPQETSDYD